MLLEAEAAIVKRIQAILTPFEVTISPFPGDLDDSPKPGRKGQIFIGYKRSRFRLTSMQPATLEVIAEYELSLMLKDLRSHTGAYPLLDRIRYAITGFIPLKGPSHKCYPVQEGFLKVEDKIWYYAMVVAVAMQQIEGNLGLYEPLDDDVYSLPPGQVRPYRPGQPVQLQTGTWRARVDNRDANVLDRGYTIDAIAPEVNPAVLLGSGSGFDISPLLSVENVQMGTGSGFDVSVLPAESIEMGTGSGFDVSVLPAESIEMGTGSGFDISPLLSAKNVQMGTGSGFDVSVLPAESIEMGTGSGINLEPISSQLVTHANNAVVTGTGARWVAYMNDMSHLALEPEMITYQNNVVENGGAIAFSDLVALNVFVKECKKANIWDKLLEIYPFAGNNLNAALVKLKTATNQNILINSGLNNSDFSETDYDRFSGLNGNISGKRLLSGFNPANFLQPNNTHIASWCFRFSPFNIDGVLVGVNGNFHLRIAGTIPRYVVGDAFLSGIRSGTGIPLSRFDRGFFMGSSNFGEKYMIYPNGIRVSTSVALGPYPISSADMTIFAQSSVRFFNGRISTISVGFGLTLQEAETLRRIMNDLNTSLGRNR